MYLALFELDHWIRNPSIWTPGSDSYNGVENVTVYFFFFGDGYKPVYRVVDPVPYKKNTKGQDDTKNSP